MALRRSEGQARGQLPAAGRDGRVLSTEAILLLAQIAAKVRPCLPPLGRLTGERRRVRCGLAAKSLIVYLLQNRVLLLSADSEREMEEWMSAISRRRLIRQANSEAQVP
jgi:hypothetical protein